MSAAQTAAETPAEPGRLTWIVGPSGAGKTRALRAAFKNWRERPTEHWPAAAMLGQNPATQIVADTVREEVAFALEAAQTPAANRERRVDRALAAFGLEPVAATPTDALSMGWKCRTLLAALHALEARAYFLDEPYAQLDDEGAALCTAAIEAWLRDGRAVVATRHEAEAGPLAETRLHRLRPETGLSPDPSAAAALAEHLRAGLGGVDGAPALVAEGLCAGHETGPDILSGLDLVIASGQLVAIIGANGAGKSTLLRALAGDAERRGGRLTVAGLAQPTTAQLSGRVALTLQDPELHLTGASLRGEVALAAQGRLPPEAVEAALALFGLTSIADRPSFRLSHGQKQLTTLAAALASAPRLALLDEPLCGVDPAAATAALEGLRALARETGLAVLAVTHADDTPLAQAADARFILADGRLRDA